MADTRVVADEKTNEDDCFVRWCSNRSDIKTVRLYLQMNPGRADRQTLDLIRHAVLESDAYHDSNHPEVTEASHKEISVYRADSRKPTAIGHAMAVVAVAIGTQPYEPLTAQGEDRPLKSKHKKAIRKRKGATIKLGAARLRGVADVRFSPETCTTITPAAKFHYNIRFGPQTRCTTDQLADFVVDELSSCDDAICDIYSHAQGSLTESPFLEQATTVLNYCCKPPFLLRQAPNEEWKKNHWTADEQVARLKRLADAIEYEIA